MAKEGPLVMRLYFEPHLYELARVVNYGGVRTEFLRLRLEELRERHGERKVMLAVSELTEQDEKARLTVLKPYVRRICCQLLGPPPEHPEYADYWQSYKKSAPPECHRPPKDEVPPPAAPKRGKRGKGGTP